MKSVAYFLISIILISWQSIVFAYSSDEFLIGTYSNLKPYPENTTFNSNILSIMKSEGNYNVSICDNPLPDSYPASSVDGLLQAHYLQGIDPWLCDYHTGYNSTGEIISAGTHALSTGNYWRFEAEFFDIGRPYGYTEVDNNSNVYFHQFSRNIANRIGYATMDIGNIVPRKVWACSPDTAGVVLHGLRQRFPAADASNTVSNPPRYDRIGPEFRFTQWDLTSWDETGPIGQHYLSWDKLYVRYVFRVASGSPHR